MTNPGHAIRRSPGSRRGTFTVAAAVLAAIVSCIVSVPAASASAAPDGQALVVLSHDKIARTSPSSHARQTRTVASRRPLTGEQTTLPVLGQATDKHGHSWVDVRLPGRPNSGSGWMTTGGTTPSWTPWRLSVNLNARQLTVYYRGRIKRRFPAIVGKPSTPTPTGHFFIEEGLALSPGTSGAPYALATSDRSNVLRRYAGGPGQIAIHGMAELPGALGTASSHGCIRLDATDVTWLAMRVGPGVPLTIFA